MTQRSFVRLVVFIIILIVWITNNVMKKQKNKLEVQKIKNYALEIINNKNDNDPILRILEIIQKKCNHGEKMDVLSKGERLIYLMGDLEGEVNNGGFSQYFFNSSGKYADETILILKEIGAKYTSSLLEEAKKIYKSGPTNDGRDEPEVDLTDSQEEKLNELDNKFYEYKDNLNELQITYIKLHITDF